MAPIRPHGFNMLALLRNKNICICAMSTVGQCDLTCIVSKNGHLIKIHLALTLSITDMSTVAIETEQINLPITHQHHISLTGW